MKTAYAVNLQIAAATGLIVGALTNNVWTGCGTVLSLVILALVIYTILGKEPS